jgi:hypothetical protein
MGSLFTAGLDAAGRTRTAVSCLCVGVELGESLANAE